MAVRASDGPARWHSPGKGLRSPSPDGGSEPLEAVVREIEAAGGEAFALTCDVTQTRFGGGGIIPKRAAFRSAGHTIVNNAGAVVVATAEHTSDEDWEKVIAANLTGTFLVSRAALPALRRAGRRLDRQYRFGIGARGAQRARGLLRRQGRRIRPDESNGDRSRCRTKFASIASVPQSWRRS